MRRGRSLGWSLVWAVVLVLTTIMPAAAEPMSAPGPYGGNSVGGGMYVTLGPVVSCRIVFGRTVEVWIGNGMRKRVVLDPNPKQIIYGNIAVDMEIKWADPADYPNLWPSGYYCEQRAFWHAGQVGRFHYFYHGG